MTQKQELYFDPSIKLVQKVVCSCALLNFAIWYWNTFLNKGGYAMHHLNVYFLLFFFFANDLLLSVYFIFILEMMLDKKQIEVFLFFLFFFLQSKWVLKQQGQLTTSTMHSAQELLTV